jgi:hypothetical protein
MDGWQDEEEAGNVDSEHDSVSRKYETDDSIGEQNEAG